MLNINWIFLCFVIYRCILSTVISINVLQRLSWNTDNRIINVLQWNKLKRKMRLCKRIELLPSCQNLKREEMHPGPLKNGVQRAYNENTLVHNIMCGVSLPWQWDLKYMAHKNTYTDKYNLRSYLKILDTAFCDKILFF